MSSHNKKLTGSHTTLTDASKEVINFLSKHDEVTKISAGIIKQTYGKGGNRGLKQKPITGGLQVTVRGGGTVQELYIYTKNSESTIEKLSNLF